MPNKVIPIIDKVLVVRRMAEGQSTRQAIKGTSISSNQTAARIAKQQSHTITRLREEYMDSIDKYAASRDYRAAMLADMVWANKTIRIARSNQYGGIGQEDALFNVPDWNMRLKAIKYIDQIAGITTSQGSQINVIQQVKS